MEGRDDVINLIEIDDVLKSSSSETLDLQNQMNRNHGFCEDVDKMKEQSSEKADSMMVVDEWNDCGLESESEEDAMKRDMSYINPEDVERALLNMPTLKQITDEMGHLKHNRKVTASPLSFLELSDSHIVELISWGSLREFQTSFVRDVNNREALTGIVTMAFSTCKSANNAVELLRAWKDNLDVKIDTHSHHTVDTFVDKNGVKKKWTDNVAVLRNLSAEVTEEAIRDLFPCVEDVVMRLDKTKKSFRSTPTKASEPPQTISPSTTTTTAASDSASNMDTGATTEAPRGADAFHTAPVLPSAPPKGIAFLVFSTEETMRAEVEAAVERRLELCGYKLMLLAYKTPVHAIPRSYLRLYERKAVLTYIERCSSKLEALKQSPGAKVPAALEEKLSKSKSVLESDNQSRKDLGLPQPSLEQLSWLNGLPRLSSANIQKTLLRCGILVDKRRESEEDISRRHYRESRFRTSSRRGRKSPYRRNNHYKPYRGSYNSGGRSGSKTGSQTSLLGNASLANPLAQLVMQQNLLGGGRGRGMSGGYGGGAPMDGLLGNPYMQESHSGLIRLDETGNFRNDNEARYPALNHYDHRPDYRRRSRSPRSNYGRRDNSVGNRDIVRGGGGMHGAGTGDDSVNLLLNLSQMLSNKMDQKRHQMEQDKRMRYNDY